MAITHPRHPTTNSPTCSRPLVTDRERDAPYNVTPTSGVYVVLDDGEAPKVDLVRWGFVPGWAKDLKIGSRNCTRGAQSTSSGSKGRRAARRKAEQWSYSKTTEHTV